MTYTHRWFTREGTRGIRAFLTVREHEDGRELLDSRVEGYIASGAEHTGFGITVDEDTGGPLVFLGVAHLFDVWVTAGSPRLRKWLTNRWPDIGERHIVDFRYHDRAIWWEIWHDRGWTRGTPRWQSGNFHWWDFLTGKPVHSKEIIEGPVEVDVPMPEGSYRATVAIELATWKRPRWPWPMQRYGYDLNVISRPGPDGPYIPEPNDEGHRPPGYIPVPGKGENAWDCGTDGTFAISGPGRTVETAIGDAVSSTLRDRKRRGYSHAYAEPTAPAATDTGDEKP